MRKFAYILLLLLPLLGIPYILKSNSPAHKKRNLVMAPAPVEKIIAIEIDTTDTPKVKPFKAKTTKTAEKSAKKPATKTLPIEDSFRAKAHHQPGTLGYKHWTGWYYPTKFILTINDTEVINFDGKEFTRANEEITFNPAEPLKIHFLWEFLHGRRTGWRTTEFKLDASAKSIDIDFDWKDQWQIYIDHATPIASTDKGSKSHEDK